ncbi:MAG: hypothetical protein QOE31_3975, partial [Solirubrobacteraceae bacterium]|nr:hypothetical protein [Solirubrobacteraceae bacterium]
RAAELRALKADLHARDARLSDSGAEIEAYRHELAGAREEIGSLREELETVRGELETTRASAEDVRVEREQARVRAAQLLSEAESARAAAEAIRAEFAFEEFPSQAPAPAAPTPSPFAPRTPFAPRSPFSPPAKPISAEAAAAAAAEHSHTVDGPLPELPACEPGTGAALIGLDGHFVRLDDAFSTLLGAREDELRAARWPSIIDRENLDAHLQIARALLAGEIQSADIETIYMHAGGLLVPVEGTVTMHRDDAGRPTHYVFRADVRRTSGATR